MRNYYMLCVFILSNSLFSQKKIYSGNYENGHAEYEYYENPSYERILDGFFKYHEKDFCKINGMYSQNLKEGKWMYVNDFKNSYTKIFGNYKSGKKQGSWSYIGNGYPYFEKLHKTVSLNFSNDTVVDKIVLPNLNGELDHKGHFVGKWHLQIANNEFLAEFKDNTLLNFIKRKVDTGEILQKYTLTDSISTATLYNSSLLSQIADYRSICNIGENYTGQILAIKDFHDLVQDKLNQLQSRSENNFINLNPIILGDFRLLTKKEKVDNREDIKIYLLSDLDKQPYYPGGLHNFLNYIKANYRIPEDLSNKGKVTVSFVIYDSGEIGNFKIVEDLNFGTGQELIRTIKSGKIKWKPGEKNNKSVNALYQVTINL